MPIICSMRAARRNATMAGFRQRFARCSMAMPAGSIAMPIPTAARSSWQSCSRSTAWTSPPALPCASPSSSGSTGRWGHWSAASRSEPSMAPRWVASRWQTSIRAAATSCRLPGRCRCRLARTASCPVQTPLPSPPSVRPMVSPGWSPTRTSRGAAGWRGMSWRSRATAAGTSPGQPSPARPFRCWVTMTIWAGPTRSTVLTSPTSSS